jgi:hypothetical protein
MRLVSQLGPIGAKRTPARPIKEGAGGREFFVIIGGTVGIERGGKKIDALGPGDFFGEASLLTDKRRNATVKTTSDRPGGRAHEAALPAAILGCARIGAVRRGRPASPRGSCATAAATPSRSRGR